MSLETASVIADLNELWPLGSDRVLDVDGHLRTVKTAVKSLGNDDGAQQVGFIQDAAAAVARDMLDKGRETVTPEDFGVVGGLAAGDTAKLQAFFDYVTTNGKRGRFTKVDQYKITSALTITVRDTGFTLEGANMAEFVIDSTFAGATPALTIVGTSVPVAWSIGGFNVRPSALGAGAATHGVRVGATAAGVTLLGYYMSRIHDVAVSDFATCWSVQHARMVQFDRCSSYNVGATANVGLEIKQANSFTGDLVFDNCQFVTTKAAGNKGLSISSTTGPYNSGTGDNSIAGIKFRSTVFYAGEKAISIYASAGSNIGAISFDSGCQIDQEVNYNVYVESFDSGTVIEELRFNGMDMNKSTTQGMLFTSTGTGGNIRSVWITKNRIINAQAQSILVYGAACTTFHVDDNDIEDSNYAGPAIQFAGGDAMIATNNRARMGILLQKPDYLLGFDLGTTNIYATGNNSLSGVNTNCILDNSGAVTKIIADNPGATFGNKDTTDGYAGLTALKINFLNVANTFTSFLTNTNTAARTYTFQDRNGTIADDTDLAGKQPLDATLTALAAANWAANALPIGSGADTLSQVSFAANTFPARASTGNLVAKTISDTALTAVSIAVGSAGGIVTNGGALGTPSSGTLTSCTGLPVNTGISGLGTGVATALAVNVGSAGAFVTFGGALGTPSSGVATNLTGTAASLTAGSATILATARGIYGNNFDGSAALTQIIASTYGGTGNGFAKLSGPATSEKTFTLPNATCTILTDNAAVTVAQGGTGLTTLTANRIPYGNGTSAFQSSANWTLDGTTLTGSSAGASTAMSLTSASAGSTLTLIDTGTSGVNFKMQGNGGGSDSIYQRVFGGDWQVLNSGYAAVIAAITQAGAFSAISKITAFSGTAPGAGGTAGMGLFLSSTSLLGIMVGTGAPTASAAKGTLYLNTTATTTTTRLYINTNGSTTWTNFTSAA